MPESLYSLITGASEGFGKALALECASRNMNLVLVALPGPALENLAVFIRKNFPVDVITKGTDLSKEENCMELFTRLNTAGIKINMLINNAGLGSTMLFSEGSIQLYQTQIRLNIMATTLLTRLFVPILERNSPSYILNVGSLSSFFFLAKKQVYGGTKSYIYFFSKSLQRELSSEGIHVSVICPGSMNTNISVIMQNKACNWITRKSVMEPEDVARIAINGLLRRKEVIIPGFTNKFFLLLDKLLPETFKKAVTSRQMNKLNSVQAAGKYTSPVIQMEDNYSLSA